LPDMQWYRIKFIRNTKKILWSLLEMYAYLSSKSWLMLTRELWEC